MARRCCSTSHAGCCEQSNVALAVCALILSALAAAGGVASGLGAGRCCDGDTLNSLKVLEWALPVWCSGVAMLNLLCAVAVWLSFFHCACAGRLLVQCLTTSRALCCLRVLVMATFVAQLALSQYLLVWRCAVSTLSFICGLPEAEAAWAQQVLQALAVSHGDGTAASLLHLQDVIRETDIQHYCDPSQATGVAPRLAWPASLLLVLTQALMAVALNGEKERVGVHELSELAAFAGLPSEDARSLSLPTESPESHKEQHSDAHPRALRAASGHEAPPHPKVPLLEDMAATGRPGFKH